MQGPDSVHNALDFGIARHQTLGMKFAQRDMLGPVVGAKLSHAIQR